MAKANNNKRRGQTQQQRSEHFNRQGWGRWQRRIIKSFKGNAAVESKVVKGLFDRFLTVKP